MSDLRSVQVGCSHFSRCCHLFSDLLPSLRIEVGQAIDAVTGTRLWASVVLPSTKLLPTSSAWYCAAVRKLHHRPTAFHEKAGRSQVGSSLAPIPRQGFSSPSRHCRHPSIRTLNERSALGASWVFSFQPVLPPVQRPSSIVKDRSGPGDRRSHRNSALGIRCTPVN